jgi:hypothetical protein
MRDGGETSKRVASDPRAGWVELQEARWDAARASFQQALATEATPEALEGLSWAAWWLDDAAAVFEARERAYGLYRKRGDGTGAARMATWLAADHLDFHGAWAVASGWLRRAHRLLDPLGARAGSRLARLSRGVHSPRERRHGAGPRAGGLCRGARPAVRGCRPGDARARTRRRRTRGLRRSRRGNAVPRRGHGGSVGGRGGHPDLERLGLLHARLCVHSRARLRTGLRMVRPDRRVRGPLRQPLHARLLQGRVRRGPPLARPVVGRRADAPGLGRGLLPLTPGVGDGP